MKTIWKYELKVDDLQTVSVPAGAMPLKVGVQTGSERMVNAQDQDVPVIWMLVDPDAAPVELQVRILGTGHRCEDPGWYLGSFQLRKGHGSEFVGHVFMVAEKLEGK